MEITECTPVESSLDAVARSAERVHKLLCIGPNRVLVRLKQQCSEAFPELEFTFSKPNYLEVTARGGNKRYGLETLCRYYGVSSGEAVAFGDSFSDIPMLEAAGMGVAMGNAPDAVKKKADRVTASNDEDGVYIALKNLRFQKPSIRERGEKT